jgi:hypothetical protein
VEYRTFRGRTGSAWSLDDRDFDQQRLVICGERSHSSVSRATLDMRRVQRVHWTEQHKKREPDAVAVLHQLQPEEGLVSRMAADHHCQLGSS